MTEPKWGRCRLEFKQEATRFVEPGQSQAAVARSLGVIEQMLGNWVKAHRAGTLKGASSKPGVTAEQMENSRFSTELARVTIERDILGRATAYFAKTETEILLVCAAVKSKRHSTRQPETLNDAILLLAQPGGYLACTHNPPPGN
jgi:transposase